MSRNRSLSRLLVTLGLSIAAFALSATPAFATHFRYATIYWTRDLTYSNPAKPTEAKVTITIQVGMRWTYPSYSYTADGPVPSNSVSVACAGVVTMSTDMLGGASCPPLGAYVLPTGSLGYGLVFNKAVTVVAANGKTLTTPINVTGSSSPAPGFGYPFYGIVTQVVPTQDTFYAQATLDVLVDTSNATAASPLVATWEDANRLSMLMDGNNDIPWIVGTAIDLTLPITRSPQSVSSAIVQVFSGAQNTVTLPVQTFDNMIAHYRLATSAESGLTSVQPVSPSVFSLNAQTGQVLFTPRALGFYAVQFKVGAVDPSTGVVENEVPLDMIFQAVSSTGTNSVALATGDGQTTYTATVPQPISFTVNATPTPTNAAYTVTISNTVLPAGATFTQSGHSGAGPVTGTFNWTPTVNSTSSSVCFSATVTNGQVLVAQSIGSLCVTINLNPLATVLTPSPASGDGGGPLTLSAKLTRQLDNAPLPGRAVNFTWSDPTNAPWVADCPPTLTDTTGTATCIVVTDRIVASGTYYATFNAIANELLQSSAGAGTVVVKGATTTLDPPTTPTNPYNSVGYPVTVSDVLNRVDTDGGIYPPPGSVVQFTLTDPNATQTVLNGAVAGSQGVASVTFPADTAPVLGNYSISAYFAGNDLLFGGETSTTTTFAMGQRLKLTALPATAGVSVPAALQATLTDIPQGTPVSGRNVTFTFGTTTLQATTDVNGLAQVSGTFPSVGSVTFNVSTPPNTSAHELNDQGLQAAETASGTVTVTPAAPTTLTTTPFAGTSWTPSVLTARLTTGSPATPLSGMTVTFSIAGVTVGTAVTDINGLATLALTPDHKVSAQYAAAYAGQSGAYLTSSSTSSFNVANAPSTTAITCTSPVTFNGTALMPCTATVTGAGGLSQPAVVTFTNNVNAGTASASASFAGDASHDGSTGLATFAIAPALSATVVTCPATAVTFTGTAQTPCTATATGDGGLSQSLTVAYASNVGAGTASATASFAGDANHAASSGAASFTIAPAASTTVVSCPSTPVTFTGAAQTPCTATATGAGGLSQTVAVTYTNNVSAGSASASASFAGDVNHASSSGTATFTIGLAATTTVVSCPAAPVTFTGAAQTPCSATVTGDGGLSQSVTVAYTNNVSVGSASATASYAGDANHGGSNGAATFTIGVAATTTVVSCPTSPVVFTGSAQTQCTATVTGDGGLNAPVPVSYTNNTNAGSASATASYAGDANHSASTGSATFTIGLAATTTVITCPASVTFNGSAQTPCSATATGVGGLNQSVPVTYSNNLSAGSASASASYAGDSNHAGSNAAATFTIGLAASTTVVTCPAAPQPFSGAAQTPCTATVTGDGGLSQSLGVNYASNTAAGVASATAGYPGDTNHTNSTGSATFTIGKASSATVVTCPASVTFNGSAETPCTAAVTGAGGLTQSPSVIYNGNTSAGTASASASYAGDVNHDPSSGSASFTINTAASAVAVSCPATVTFNGSAQTPCTATVSGAGGLSQPVTVSYTGNVNAGTANASATYAGDANHAAASGSATFAIAKASSAVAVSCPASVVYNGAAQAPCTASATAADGLSQSLMVILANNTNAGVASASASFAGDANHTNSSGSATFVIAQAASVTAVACPASVTYNGAAQTPCTASVSGAGGLSQAAAVSYASNTNAGTASASASFAGDANHAGSSGAGSFAIAKRTPTVTWPAPAAINQGTKLGTKQLNATASVPGTFVYNPAAGTTPGPGTQTLSVTFTPTDQANNTTATASVSITVDATGSVNVGPGQTVIYNGGSVKQNVTVNGGTLVLTNGAHIGGQVVVLGGAITTSNSTITGNLEIGGPSTFAIGPGTVVMGNLLVGLMPNSTTTNTMCGAQVTGNVDYGASAAPVVIGSPATGCAGNVVTGQMLINLSNAPVQVFGNRIGQQLECTLNSSITGGGNTARQKLGQCAAF